MVLPYTNMYPPQVYTCSLSWTPSLLPPRTIPLGHLSAPAPSIQYHASNLDWRFISYMILYMFQCHSPKSSHPLPLPLPQSPKDCSIHLCLFCCLTYRVIVSRQSEWLLSKSLFYTSVSLLLSRIQGYRYHLSKFHIYALVFLPGESHGETSLAGYSLELQSQTWLTDWYFHLN